MNTINPHLDMGIATYDSSGLASFEKFDTDPTDTTFPKLKSVLLRDFEKIPVLDIGEDTGHTGYLDFIQIKQMTAPIMRGVDSAGRPFIAFRLQYSVDGGSRKLVQVLFRRYRTGSTWTSAGRGGESFLTISTLKDKDIEYVRQLITGIPVGKREYRYDTGEERCVQVGKLELI